MTEIDMKNQKIHVRIMAFFKNEIFRKTVRSLLIIGVLISVLLNWFTLVMPVVKYYGSSMSPALTDGQIIAVSRQSEVQRGDIVAFYYNNKVLVRRVIATQGQRVSIDIFGQVSVDGVELEEAYVEEQTLGQCDLEFPYVVPTGTYFVLGDNRVVSMDSRLEQIGPVAEDRLIGKIVFSIWPLRKIH